jgi:multicomponent Na+:H+ antiporter subunit C
MLPNASVLLAATIGLMITVATLQLLQRDAIRMVMGLYVLWHALNLLLLGSATVRGSRAPFTLEGAGPIVDPLVQALVLTAIVISLGFSAFLLILVYWLAHRGRSVDVDQFTEGKH